MTTAGAAAKRLHPLTILFATFTIARSFLLPAAIGIFSASRRGNLGLLTTIGAGIAGIGSLLAALAKYTNFRYVLLNDTLVIDSGVFLKKHRVIPLESVQNIEVRETALQRLFSVASLKVETATGGVQADAEFSVLGRETADRLREGIMARRGASPSTAGLPVAAPDGQNPETELARMSTRDLIVAGATANRAGVVIAAVAGGYQLIDDLPYPTWIRGIVESFPDTWVGTFTLVAGTVVALLVIGWLLSILGSFLRYHGFTLVSRDEQLHISHGLLSRHKTVLPMQRVQALRIEESILRRPLSLAAIRAEAAGSAQLDGGHAGAELIVPLSASDDVARLVAAIFPDARYADISLKRVHPRSKSRAFTRYALILLLAAAGAAFWKVETTLLLPLLLPLAWLLAAWQYRHRGYAAAPGYVVARNGVLNRITWLVPERKMQTMHLKESPFQRRHGLASVVLDTAGSGRQAVVRDVEYGVAAQLVDRLRPALSSPDRSSTRTG